jgi:xanthine dehydrogenase YagR molybdenum-binding subunit
MSAPLIGQPVSRVDGRLKVTGQARYAAEFEPGPDLTYAVIVDATIPRGRLARIDASEAESAPGVLSVITHRNAPQLAYREHKGFIDPTVGERLHVFQDDQVRFNGQPIGVVVAETLEQATHAATLLRVAYAEEPGAETVFKAAFEKASPPHEKKEDTGETQPPETSRGDAHAAFAAAEVRVDARYWIPRENHNPIELHATVAAWEGDRLTLWDKSQWVHNTADEIAAVFGMSAENVRVISPFVGGAFGSSLRTWPHVTIAALAARQVGRPVKLVLTRRQMYFGTGFRPTTDQRVALGSTRDGRLTAIIHEATAETSTYEEFTEATLNATRFLHSCPNVDTQYRLAAMNVNTPTFMRGPGEVSGVYALECAMDELAVELGMDPIELRLKNEPAQDEFKKLPFSSRSTRECYRVAAEKFGWARRTPEPRSMRDGRLLIGQGMAAATYPTIRAPARAKARLMPDGTAHVTSAASDMGPGTWTSMTQVAADALGLPLDKVRFELGDTALPRAPVHGGSITMASVGSAVQAACQEARRQATARAGQPNIGLAEVLARIGEPIEAEVSSQPGDETRRFSMHAFGAVFAEVAVDPELGETRVRRIVGAYGAGRIVNPKTARSQSIGGMVGGIGMALLEHTVVDERNGRVTNGNIAEYIVPVNADVRQLEVSFVEEHDPHVNPLGVKGVGEIAQVGVAAAIANAVYHATGKRIRDLPITPEKLL